MKRIILTGFGLLLFAATAAAQPAIRTENGVLNASSYIADVAQGSWFVMFGTGMGPANLAVYSGSLPYPTELSGTRVSFTPAAGGTAVDARVWYTLAGQVAAMLPSGTAQGEYDVRVTYNSQTSAPRRVRVVARNFGFATQAQNGAGPAQATYGGLDLNRFTTGQIGQWATRPARANDPMVLWGTGLGADANSDLNGGTSGDQTGAGQVRVIVGGIEVVPAYAGRSSGSPGLDQINFTVPANVAPGCFVSLQVRAGGRTSNLGSIAVAAAGAGACTHPTYTEAQLRALDQGGTLTIGSLTLGKTATKISIPGLGSFDSRIESAFGSFARYRIDAVASASFSLTQIGSCAVIKRIGTATEIVQGTPPTPLNAGTQLRLNGPNASNISIPRDAESGAYSATLYSSGVGGFGGSGSPTLTQGTYTISGTGGADIGAFSSSVNLPGDFVWSNQDTLPDPIPRSSPLNITWTGGTTGLVSIVGISAVTIGGTQQNPIVEGTVFVCTAQATAGSFSVPPGVLQQLPPASGDITSSSFGTLAVFVGPDFAAGQGTFSAPLTAGGQTDFGFFAYSIGSSKFTGWN